jgi:hypothetical protein
MPENLLKIRFGLIIAQEYTVLACLLRGDIILRRQEQIINEPQYFYEPCLPGSHESL